ncbi:MAG: haloacid dehalogenase-like hydrolase [Rhodobacteraceae bacterium]|nr:haloacid dehalogenase-like hydrolase [Paracoccaceae bacterium]
MTDSAGDAAQGLLAACPDTVLAVDLDGTLVQIDMLRNALAGLLARAPWSVFALGAALVRGGRPGIKRAVARRAGCVPADLPYNPHVLALIRHWRGAGRKVVLATAADARVAEAIAAHLGLFDAVHASAPGRNLKGRVKADFLVQNYGARGFVYVGDSRADLHVWKQAAGAALASSDAALKTALAALGLPVQSVAMPPRAGQRTLH